MQRHKCTLQRGFKLPLMFRLEIHHQEQHCHRHHCCLPFCITFLWVPNYWCWELILHCKIRARSIFWRRKWPHQAILWCGLHFSFIFYILDKTYKIFICFIKYQTLYNILIKNFNISILYRYDINTTGWFF